MAQDDNNVYNRDIEAIYKIKDCLEWIKENKFQKVCLQIPDAITGDAVKIATILNRLLVQEVHLLLDTAYESCCVDYAAARRIEADAIIHFGISCQSEYVDKNLPILHVTPQPNFNVIAFTDRLAKFCTQQANTEKARSLICSPKYENIYRILTELNEPLLQHQVKVKLPTEFSTIGDDSVIYISDDSIEIETFQKHHSLEQIFQYDPTKTVPEIENFSHNSNVAKRRNFLIEKIKDANVIGVVVATLAVKNYLVILDRVKKLCKAHKKTCYTISVGKPNVAKLANFPEIDVFIVIACPANEIYQSRDFYKPIASPYDIETALNANHSENVPDNPFDYNQINLESEIHAEPLDDVSLISGNIRGNVALNVCQDSSFELIDKDCTIATNEHSGARYLNERMWKGLKQNLGGDEPKLAEVGRSGIAKGYENEK